MAAYEEWPAGIPPWTYCMEIVKQSSLKIRLLPFLQSVVLYFLLTKDEVVVVDVGAAEHVGIVWDVWLIRKAVVKMAPVSSLVFLLTLQLQDYCHPRAVSYCRKICLGLFMSGIGDALLVWNYLAKGMVFFAIAHCLYISAFTFKPLCIPLGVILFVCTAIYNSFLTPPEALKYLVPIYSMFLASMAWRGVARARGGGHSGLASAVGSVFFLLSDMILAYTMFNEPLEYGRIIVMSTYYFGQLCIALSAVDLARRPVADDRDD